jgi:hypothetical protein
MKLKPGNASKRADRCADFSGEIGKGADVVAKDGGDIGELGADELHAVARVAAEADDGRLEFADGFAGGRFGRRRHRWGLHKETFLE